MSVHCSISVLSPPRDIQHTRSVQDQVLPVANLRRQSALLTQLLHQESRESSRTLTRPSLHRVLHRHIGHHGLGLGVAAAPRDHEIECRLVVFTRIVKDDHFKGAQGLSSRFASDGLLFNHLETPVLRQGTPSVVSSPIDLSDVLETLLELDD